MQKFMSGGTDTWWWWSRARVCPECFFPQNCGN